MLSSKQITWTLVVGAILGLFLGYRIPAQAQGPKCYSVDVNIQDINSWGSKTTSRHIKGAVCEK